MSSSSSPSSRCAAKCAICGLKTHAYGAVASTMALQKSSTLAAPEGRRPGSGSRPTQTRVSRSRQASRSCVMNDMVRSPHAKRPPRGAAVGSGQFLVLHPLGAGIVAHATLLVRFVLVVVAREELHVGIAFEGQDVRGDAVEEPAVMRDHHRAAGEF